MKLINQSYEICKSHGYTLQGINKDIEQAARVSYRSEDKITEDSAEKMIQRLIIMKHNSPLEFGTVYLKIKEEDYVCNMNHKYNNNQFSRVATVDNIIYITTNCRVILENGWKDDLNYLCEPTEYHIRRTTVKFTCPRIISQMFMRHRGFSFLQESQRYVAYDKDKFGNEISFVRPVYDKEDKSNYSEFFTKAEEEYMRLRNEGYKPQQARAVLPNYTATSFYMCGFDDDWEKFFELRDKDVVDPQMYDLAHKLHLEFIEKGKCK